MTNACFDFCVVISESAENNCWEEFKVPGNACLATSCDTVMWWIGRFEKISYSSHAVLLKPVQKLFPSFGKWETTVRGYKAFQAVWITVILGASVSTWLSVACKHKSQSLSDEKLFLCTLCAKVYEVTRTIFSSIIPVAFSKEKCQKLISGYSKTQIIQKFRLLWYRTTLDVLPRQSASKYLCTFNLFLLLFL